MFSNNDLRQRVLSAKANKMQTSGSTALGLLPGMSAKLDSSPYSRIINPELGSNISAKVPVGQPIVPLSIPAGMAVEESITVVIDTTSLGNTTAKQRIILFDEGAWFRSKNGISSAFPANTVYINSAANNLYTPWVSGLCGNTYVFAGVKIDVSPAASAAATAAMQFQERIVSHNVSTRETKSTELDVANYNDPSNFDRNTRIISLTDQKARVDRQTAWDYYVYHGMVLTLTFYPVTYARD